MMKPSIVLSIFFIIVLILIVFYSVLESEINSGIELNDDYGQIDFSSYFRHSEINEYLDRLAMDYPEKVNVIMADKTLDDRELKYIKISTTNWTDPNTPVIIINGGIHAREWISSAFTLYIINKLVENVTEIDVAEKLNWIIIPVLNPDGYEYTHDFVNTGEISDRFWRKNRRQMPDSSCLGVDLNRNFGFHWMPTDPTYSYNNDPMCADNYAGEEAFSEIESRVLRDVFIEFKGRAKGFVDFHSHGSYIFYPWSYDTVDAPYADELDMLARRMAKAIEALQAPDSQNYTVGNTAKVMYPASGATTDYATAVGGITFAYGIELPSGGMLGFDLPSSEIEQVVTETWAGMLVFARHIIAKYK